MAGKWDSSRYLKTKGRVYGGTLAQDMAQRQHAQDEYYRCHYRPEHPADWHGHVRPNPSGVKARCGGPAVCPVCAYERDHVATVPWMSRAPIIEK